ncbi:MAG TPA: TonB-dependent receptor [Bacteroidales bacterium]|nr:TonB-dependent receptor [Bacteroidales bacterium]
MKQIFSLVLSIIISSPLFPQTAPTGYQVRGEITERVSGQCVPYATIILVNDSLKEKKILACDVSGHFSVSLDKKAEYILTVTSVGYKTLSIPVNVTDKLTDLGKLSMDEGVELKEVNVTAQKPLVKMDADKVTYNMESDPDAQSANALEMLRKVPLITVDAEENIALNGQTNFKVLVNGKSSTMMSSNLKEVLKSFPANTIKNIEVITNPPSKYDAEGVGGIINIITVRKTINGYNGSIGTGMDSRGSLNWNSYATFKVNKLSFSARYFASQFRQPEADYESKSEYFNNDDFHYSHMNSNNKYHGISNGFSGEASYEIDSMNLISLSFSGYQGSYKNDASNETQYMDLGDEVTRWYSSTTANKNSFGSFSGNIDYQKTFKKPDKSLTFSYLLDNEPNTTKASTLINGMINYPSYKLRNENEATGREQTVQVDYFDPLTKAHQFEGGVKLILRQNISNSESYRNDTVKSGNTNELDYDQYILGAYTGYVVNWKKFSTKAGLRLERTWNDGVSKTSGENTDFTNRLLNLVPYVTLSYVPKPGENIKLSYTQRLARPGISYLNPYVDDVDSMNVSYGNPILKAEVSHSFELSYSYFTPKFNLSTRTFASFVNNSIEEISKIRPNGVNETTYKNIGKNSKIGMSLYFSYRPNNDLSINFNGSADYTKIEADDEYRISNEGFSCRAILGGRWNLWKNGSINIDGGLYSPTVTLQRKSPMFYYTSFGASQYFLKRKLMLSASVRDPFCYRKKFSFDMNDITFKSNYEIRQLAQTFRLGLTYNFGKMDLQVKKARRGINNDDIKAGEVKGQGNQ